jgi:hypothetical protein
VILTRVYRDRVLKTVTARRNQTRRESERARERLIVIVPDWIVMRASDSILALAPNALWIYTRTRVREASARIRLCQELRQETQVQYLYLY